ncbi:MAG TPA: phosphate ABC transporter permease subunit PstC [Acholeplasmataceae bacterium]|jgi:phosphate transport system permease protein|nr:phosphate ABC transporter permease subunit PstC [Acholeplasmataceae bacterium]
MEFYVKNRIDETKIKRRSIINSIIKYVFAAVSIICASFIIMIVIFISLKGISPFVREYTVSGDPMRVNFWQFLIGREWSAPNIYGVGYLIINTLYVILLALIIAIPCSVFGALLIAKIAPKKIGTFMMVIIEILAAIPSIVYGVFGAGFIVRIVKWAANLFGVQTAGGLSIMATSLVLAIMIIPTITTLSVSAIRAVPRELEHGSLALGATVTQTNFRVVLASAKSGIFAGIMLGVGRALGEATAVTMVCGSMNSGPTFGLFQRTNTLTSVMLASFNESEGLNYDIRFSAGLVLVVVILITNLILNTVKKKLGRVVTK